MTRAPGPVSSCRTVPEGSAFSAHLRFRKEHKPNTNHNRGVQGTVCDDEAYPDIRVPPTTVRSVSF
jgi:hypothetical protein